MTLLGDVFLLAGGIVAVIAAVGLVRFESPYARMHAAGKASPVAFLLAAVGASLRLGWEATAQLAVASAALVLTVPVGVYLLFRAVHRSGPGAWLQVDELAPAEARVKD